MNKFLIALIAIPLVVLPFGFSVHGQGPASRVNIASRHAPDGVLEPWKICDVACADSGIVDQLHVFAGERVKKGQLLASLESSTLKMQLLAAEAQAASVGKEQSVRADVDLNKRRVEAIRDARDKQFSSRMELERAEADLRISEGRLQAELEDQKILALQVERLRQQLNQRNVTAPIDGVVVTIHKEVGEFVAPNTPEVLRLVDVSKMRATFLLRLDEVSKILGETNVSVQIDGEQYPALVEQIAPFAEKDSGLIEVHVLVENPERKLFGSRCTLSFAPVRTHAVKHRPSQADPNRG